MLVADSARRSQLGSVRFQRWLPFKIVSFVSAVVLVAYYGYITDAVSFSMTLPEETSFETPDLASPSEAHIKLVRQAALLLPLVATMDESDAVKQWNEDGLRHLEQCAQSLECDPNWNKLAILNSWHFANSKNGGVSGEDIWANSTIEALEYSGYTLLYAVKPENVLAIYLHLGDHVRAVFWEGEDLQKCIQDDIPAVSFQPASLEIDSISPEPPMRCMRWPDSPDGIPIWKSFVFHFWGDAMSPLGTDWTLAPYDYRRWQPDDSDNYYLGYSIENRCRGFTATSASAGDTALLLGKHEEYFTADDMPWKGLLGSVAELVSSAQNINFTFASAVREPTGAFQETHVDQLGILTQHGFMDAIATSVAMLGVGLPFLSPSPFESLCLGTPFINPIMSWDEEDPTNRARWSTQHDALLTMDPPYVYHVHAGNATELADALAEAARAPITSFIPDDMTFRAVVERHRRIMDHDWHWRAEEVALDMEETEFGFLL